MIIALNEGVISKHAHIKVRTHVKVGERLEEKLVDTVAGRVLFNEFVPKEVGYIDELLTKKKLQNIISRVFKIVGMAATAVFSR